MTDPHEIKISVITVCFNSEKSILDTLKSVNNQNWKNLEHIIIDGGSEDNTLNIINKFGDRVTKLISEKDRGIYNAMNKGISLADGDVIGFLNSDDFYCNSSILSEYGKKFTEDKKLDAIYGDIAYIKQNTDSGIHILRNWKTGPYNKGSFSRGWVPPHPSFYAKKELFNSFGCFREDLKFASDFDLISRFMSKGIKVEYLRGNKIYMRVGGATNKSWSNIYKGNLEIIRSLKMNGFSMSNTYFLYKIMNRLKQYIFNNG